MIRCILPLLATALVQAQDLSKMKVEKVYQTLCSSCHGKDFEGGQGGSLVDGEWKHGSTDEALYQSIAKGHPKLGMIAYEGTLTPEQIRAMVIFLQEKEKEEKFKERTFPTPDPNKVTKTEHHHYRTEILTEDLHQPWAVAFLPDGRFLVTEKRGDLHYIEADGRLDPRSIKGIPPSVYRGQGGLLDVALHPDYANNGWVYLALSDPHPKDRDKMKKNGQKGDKERGKADRVRTLTAVYRGKLRGHRWVENELIWRGPLDDYSTRGNHFGSRLVFQNGYLYFPVGERGENMRTQELSVGFGKFYRIHDDGRIPKDNPTFEGAEIPPGTWSWGHRNPQGVAFHPATGELWSTEHGPRGGDELNLIEPGKNYGWPKVTLGMNYNGTPITDLTTAPGIEDPKHAWVPSIAVCGLAFYEGKAFPKWKNHLLVGALKQQEVRRLKLRNGNVIEEEIIFKDFGRVRDVRSGPDGNVYILTNTPGRLVRLLPK